MNEQHKAEKPKREQPKSEKQKYEQPKEKAHQQLLKLKKEEEKPETKDQ